MERVRVFADIAADEILIVIHTDEAVYAVIPFRIRGSFHVEEDQAVIFSLKQRLVTGFSFRIEDPLIDLGRILSRETSISALLTIPKPLTVRITINCGKF